MLKVLRENVKYLSWILWVIIGLFVLFVFVDFGTGIRTGRNNASWAAKIGGTTISQNDFQHVYRALDERNRQMYGEQYTPAMAKQMNVGFKALNQAVTQAILLMEARRIGLKVTDDELRDALMDTFHDDQGQFIGDARYQQVLQRMGWTVAGFEEVERQDLMRQKLLEALEADLYISDSEVERTYRDQVERAKVRYVELPRARFADVVVPPAEVSAYFQQHRQDYRLPEQRDGSYLLVEPSRLLDQVQISDADLQAYYKDHQEEFKQDEQVRASHILVMVNDKQTDAQARQKIDDAKRRVDKGEDFGAVARQVSEDPGSKANGGDLGFFGRGRMVKEFEDAAFSVTPDKIKGAGQLVGPIKSPFGYHLLLVTGRRPGGVQPLAEVTPQIRSRLSFDKARQLAESKAKDLAAKLAGQKPKNDDALQALAKDNPGVVFTPIKRIGQQDPVSGLGMAPSFNSAFFAAKAGDLTGAVEVPRGWAIAFVKTVYQPHAADQSEVEGKVRQALFTRKQEEKALERLTAARQEIEKGKTFDQVAAELAVPAKESPEFGASGSIPGLGGSPQLAKLAMSLPVGKVGGPVTDAAGAVLFEVLERKSWDPAKYAAAKDQTRRGLVQQRLNTIVGALIERRQRELGLEYNSQLLSTLGVGPDGMPLPAGQAG